MCGIIYYYDAFQRSHNKGALIYLPFILYLYFENENVQWSHAILINAEIINAWGTLALANSNLGLII